MRYAKRKSLAYVALIVGSGSCAAALDPRSDPVVRFECDHDRSFAVEYQDGSVMVTAGNASYRLDHGRSSIGRKYHSDRVYFIHDDDRGVLVGAAGGPYWNCKES